MTVALKTLGEAALLAGTLAVLGFWLMVIAPEPPAAPFHAHPHHEARHG